MRPAFTWTAARGLRWPSLRYVGGAVLLAAAYYGAAKVGQTLRYTASVSAIWPPAGLGIAALYLWGMRWWPGVLLGEIVVNGELLLDDGTFPIGSLLGQQAGNMAEIIVGALLLRRLIGPNAAMDRVEQVGGMLVAVGVATAISATAGTVSMVAGGVVDESGAAELGRTWWLADTSGGLVVLPLMLAWARRPVAAWRRIRTWEGAAMIGGVTGLSVVAFSTVEPIRYTVFPALIWAAFRFGPPGATLAIAITAGVAIGETANDVGPFAKQPIDHRTLSTQLYIWVVALTALFLAAVMSERERSSRELAAARRREGARAVEERRRIARDLHDSVSQALFSTVMHTRAAQKALVHEGGSPSGRVGRSLGAIAELTRSMQGEIRSLIFELHRDPVHDGLVAALARHASGPAQFGRADHRRPRTRAPPRVVGPRRNPDVRHRAGSARERAEARAGDRGARSRRGSARPGRPRGPRQRARLQPSRQTSRSLRPRLDAQPRGRDRRMAHDHKRTWVWNARTGLRPGRHGWHLMEPGRNETIAVLVVDDHEIVRRGLRAFLTASPISRS
jgi:integral membrane sensor domain MASE1